MRKTIFLMLAVCLVTVAVVEKGYAGSIASSHSTDYDWANGVKNWDSRYFEWVSSDGVTHLYDLIDTHGYVDANDSGAVVSQDYITWEWANQQAGKYGGHLVTLSSAEENESVYEYFNINYYDIAGFFLGGFSLVAE